MEVGVGNSFDPTGDWARYHPPLMLWNPAKDATRERSVRDGTRERTRDGTRERTDRDGTRERTVSDRTRSKPSKLFQAPRVGVRPTISEMPEIGVQKAKMVQAVHQGFEKDSLAAAQEYLDANHIPYSIDESLSSKEGLVLIGDDDVKIAYRGTKPNTPSELSGIAAEIVGAGDAHPIFQRADAQLDSVIQKYGMPDELLGYSRGGSIALKQGASYGIETTTFNPLVGVGKVLRGTNAKLNTIYRTTEDLASMGLSMRNLGEVNSIHPHQDSANPLEAHWLENFSETSERRPGKSEFLARAVANQGKKAGELELLDGIIKAKERGQSFTEFVHEHNGFGGQDTTPDGSSLAHSVLWSFLTELCSSTLARNDLFRLVRVYDTIKVCLFLRSKFRA